MAYADELLALTPLAYWKLDETSGTTLADASGNSRDLTATGATVNSDPVTPSDSSGRSLLLAGNTGSYAMRNPMAGMGLANLTLVMSVKAVTLPAFPFVSEVCLLSYASAATVSELRIRMTSVTGALGATVRGTAITSSVTMFGTGPRLVVLTWRNSDGRVQLWQDGVIVASGTAGAATSITTNGAIVLGQQQGAVGGTFTLPANAYFDDVALYSSVLTDAQIALLWTTFQASANTTPTITGAVSPAQNRLRVFFNTPVTGLSDTANFTIPSLTVTGATPGGGNTYVDLTTTGMVVGDPYTLTVGAGVENGTALDDNTIGFTGGVVGGAVSAETLYGEPLRSLEGAVWADPAGEPAPTVTVQYLMRAYRSGNDTYVHWLVDNEPDFLAAQAPVSAMLLEDIVVARELCASEP